MRITKHTGTDATCNCIYNEERKTGEDAFKNGSKERSHVNRYRIIPVQGSSWHLRAVSDSCSISQRNIIDTVTVRQGWDKAGEGV